ncbi:pancreatic adenocarcinoma up-regulated factor [Macrotis lagotis]|uniref:pancreatic adenocarcinoma up-regulated factor n=1 Tax=Macrotis lagotis TaxID=92651 RepID=UPI003D68B61F
MIFLNVSVSFYQIMKSFLVLFLLGGIACNCSGAFSEDFSDSGKFFSLAERNPEDCITGLRFSLGIAGLFKSIQMQRNGEWSEKYGAKGGKSVEIKLWEEESIVKVTTYKRLCIIGLLLETSSGRVFTIGTLVGQNLTAYPPEEGMVLSGIQGTYTIICLKTLRFQWKFPPVTYTSIEETTTPEIPETAKASTSG